MSLYEESVKSVMQYTRYFKKGVRTSACIPFQKCMESVRKQTEVIYIRKHTRNSIRNQSNKNQAQTNKHMDINI
jgi:hypothetical protein